MSDSYILHADADCFFVACEVLKDPSLKGKPVIATSSVGGIALAKSYEAKAFGIKTGTPEWEAKKMCPDVIIRRTDFKTYAEISSRIDRIYRTYSPDVEKYSVDESFMDLKNVNYKSLEQLGEDVRRKIKNEVGINVSVGITPNKSLSKLASDFNKPDGLKVVRHTDISDFLKQNELGDVWGIGMKSQKKLGKLGLKTAFDFYNLPRETVEKIMGKNGLVIWDEFHGAKYHRVVSKNPLPKSIGRSRSFFEFTTDKEKIWSSAVMHCENIAVKLAKKQLVTKQISIFLRTKDFRYFHGGVNIPQSTLSFSKLIKYCRLAYDRAFKYGVEYRSIGVNCYELKPISTQQYDVFGNTEMDDKSLRLVDALGEIREKYGRRSILPASAHQVLTNKRETSRLELKEMKFNK